MSDPKAIYLKDYLPPAYLVDDVVLKFDLHDRHTRVDAILKMRLNPEREKGLPLELLGSHLELVSVSMDGRPLQENEYVLEKGNLTIHSVPEQFELHTQVLINPIDNTALEGLYRSSTKFCTQCEPEGFRRITFYPDRPDVMSTFTTTVIGDRDAQPVLLSNGNPIEYGDLPENRHYVTWRDPFPKPSYLFALVAGDLEKREDHFITMSGRKVTLQIWVEKEDLDKTEFAMGALKRAMQWDEETYGREYDLDLFMIVAVGDFNMGAMENKGLNIFNSSAVLAKPETSVDRAFQSIEGIIAHEYFHNWSGNRVTCRDWFQLALKEGFTVFRDQTFSADINSEPVKRIQDVNLLRSAQFGEDRGPTAHPVRPESFIEISNFYTLTIYEKGAELVRMLRNLLGKETFRKGSDLYFSRYDGQAVRVEDFVNAMAEASGLDLSQFMRWYEQAGTPVVKAKGNYDADAHTFTLTFEQSTPSTPGQPADEKLPLHIPVRMGLISPEGEHVELVRDGESFGTDTVLEIQQATQQFVFENIDQPPVPSLLRGFSAPVELDYAYSPEQLALLVKYDEDGFNRWDAMQRLDVQAINEAISAIQQGKAPQLDALLKEVYQYLLETPTDDKAVLAEMLTLPRVAFLIGQQANIDIEATDQAVSFIRKALGEALYKDFEHLYTTNQSDEPYAPDFEQIARRQLKNRALDYLCATGREDALNLAQAQYEADANMTDVQSALIELVHSDDKAKGDAALTHFGKRWADDALVTNSWFSIQATRPQPDVLDRVRFLMEHPLFSIKNPNRMRSLIGAFAQNLANFHRADGEGYRLLADVVIQLNKLNPDIAARMVIPLTRYQRFDEARQKMMRAELERIQQEQLAPSLYEMVGKALA
ncbi:Aminopeptidase N [Halomonadaceae bacterium LMG 33818]|uniref:aminopeptidase N n=1 Tax=Cernens ardua TaxID=3402176 RepID=UPI003EDB8BF2